MLNLDRFTFVICGQALTGRLEVLESFFKNKFKELIIIGESNIFANYNAARYTAYKNGAKYSEKKLFNIIIKKNYRLKGLFFLLAYDIYYYCALFLAYTIYSICAFFIVLKFRLDGKKLVFIGIGFFPAILGAVFKKIRLVKGAIYYSIDYFPPFDKKLIHRLFVFLDKLCVKNSDLVWIISPKIIEAREKFANLSGSQYKHISVPLCFDEALLKFEEANNVERWSIVFVGTPNYLHGLHILIEAMPRLIEIFPEIRIKIIGSGSWDDTEREVNKLNLREYFNFLGFIKEEDKLFEIVSKCALGLALYVPGERNPSFYADPGKPKLYAFCAVPIVISKTPFVSKEIDISGAGKAIDFNADSLISAITEILSNDDKWNKFRKDSFSFAKRYTSTEILGPAIEDFLKAPN